ncbi:hypothetical protein MBLNU230_g2754t1 [Neophaeotheca triangularis]
MAGKRLLDAARLFNVGRSVASQHFAIRKKQWDTYTQTSSLAKAVKSQTDRVTVTAGAAYELAKTVSETGPRYGQASSQPRQHDEPSSTQENARATTGDEIQAASTASEEYWLSSKQKRELQRESESQIPSSAAGGQPSSQAQGGQDTFNERPEVITPEPSSLPRTKLPKHPDDVQGSDEHVPHGELNQDVYYGTAKRDAAEELQDRTEGVELDGAFSSPRVSQMLYKGGAKTGSPYANRQKMAPQPLPEMVKAAEQRKTVSATAHKPSQAVKATNAASPGDAETADLAASIAQEAEAQPSEQEAAAQPAAKPYEMRESRVPSSRFGRIWQYSGLATSMAFGAVGEGFRRVTGGTSTGSVMLSEANMERLVAKLSRMRGAALKLGQMVSFQDSKMLPPAINQVLQRVQDSADYMPASQRDKVLVENLGPDWRSLFSNFEEKPFAAASIGQVHKATLASNGKDVAVKVQYPGVRDSIDSDLNNISLLLTASRILPKGLFLDKTIANARVELGWECDYIREAEACGRFQELVGDETNMFTVPHVYAEASGPGVLTADFMKGSGVTKIKDLTESERDWLGTQVLRLCLRELMEWRFMQTDPNWTNFLYNRDSKKLELLDFGASRDFPDEFVVPYVNLLIAASKGDRASCQDLSIELGYLTGKESDAMLKAHVDSILTLAEPFLDSAPEVYDFQGQTITDRVRANIGLMVRERLAPPPEETYSLHRKLSGAFLLCARLGSRVKAREMFANAVKVWHGKRGKVEDV